jgi:uncharacterized spore protein YtfJ
MDVEKLLSRITDDLTPKRVFGEPIERDGVMLVPVARVRGGAGGGSGGPRAKRALAGAVASTPRVSVSSSSRTAR